MRFVYIVLSFALVYGFVFAFPMHNFETKNNSQAQVIEGCIGDCSSCHSLLPYEAKQILGKKFDVKKIISISVERGYFKIIYENSKGKKEKINLLFSKDKACKDLILLDH
ncbi:hypothetical protein [Hydrogenothermus marinus]|uniref:Uncharacterized protein n=1 Tax=Hydrogenothermus marinus TaxID=133270 RepID=A0A3M0BQE2_9AQUI|nr:hypothetical protein [Hydrogenothermus marinus]RMA93122.1 hypothetical protein CLV39_1453 [Hydrogenothermus marinus]